MLKLRGLLSKPRQTIPVHIKSQRLLGCESLAIPLCVLIVFGPINFLPRLYSKAILLWPVWETRSLSDVNLAVRNLVQLTRGDS